MNERQMTELERLQQIFEIYGSVPDRWPDGERQELLRLIEVEDEAKMLHEEAKRLDALLALTAPFAPADDSVRLEPLKARILDDFRAQRKAQSGDSGGRVIAFPSARRFTFGQFGREGSWVAAAALAACFLIGLYLGVAGLGSWALDPIASLDNLSGTQGQVADISGLVVGSGLEEDLL